LSLHADLLKQAHLLATKEPKRPAQASLRRAISASYYALFHLLVDEATCMLISRGNRNALRQCVSRAFRHSDMREVCKSLASEKPPRKLALAFEDTPLDPFLIGIATAFVELQEARHQADYNAYRLFQRQEVLDYHGLAAKALVDWNSIRRTPQADAFLAGLLVARHVQG